MNLSNKKGGIEMNIKDIARKLKNDSIDFIDAQDGTLQIWDILEDDFIQIEVISNGSIEVATENSSIQVDTYEDMIKEILEYILDEI